MGDRVLPFRDREITLEVGQLEFQTYCHIGPERPLWLKHLRIYELAPALSDESALDVLADAFEARNKDSVDAIIREYGVVGAWRPSTILVHDVVDVGSARILAHDVIAHSLWNADLHYPLSSNTAVQLSVSGDDPAQKPSQRRTIRPVLICTEMTDEELRGDGPGQARDQVLRDLQQKMIELARRVQQLERRKG